jgi:hypothetical protein
MLCCHKTGVQITRCETKLLTNPTTPKSLGYSDHTIIWTGLIALVPLNSQHSDNYDEAGSLIYRTYIAILPENIYQLNKWQIMDVLSYNDGFMASNTSFDVNKLTKSGKIYSVRELIGSLKTGQKFREVKIRFDLQ